jgi:UDP-3-O-[3-hydroxymyristoyl] glucosamine N-acyltransferase
MATLHRIRLLLGVPVPAGARDRTISQLSIAATATAESLVFATTEETLVSALASRAGGILAPPWSPVGDRIVPVADPRTAFAIVYAKWFDERGRAGIHPSAVVEDGAVLGKGCEVGAGAFIASGVQLGERCVIGPHVVIHSGTTLGNCVRVQAGTVLGSEGFGYVRTPQGHLGFPQLGILTIGDDVEIGANCTIDRGALGETRIGRGTKLDNLVHIAHNCRIGENVLIAAQVGLAGSCVIEDNAMLGGQVGLGERVTIGRGVILGGQGGVLPGKRLDGEGVVHWGTPAQPVREYLRDLARFRKG